MHNGILYCISSMLWRTTSRDPEYPRAPARVHTTLTSYNWLDLREDRTVCVCVSKSFRDQWLSMPRNCSANLNSTWRSCHLHDWDTRHHLSLGQWSPREPTMCVYGLKPLWPRIQRGNHLSIWLQAYARTLFKPRLSMTSFDGADMIGSRTPYKWSSSLQRFRARVL